MRSKPYTRAIAPEREVQTPEDVGHILPAYRHADDLVRTSHPHTHRLALRQLRHRVVHRTGLATANIKNQPGRALDAVNVVVEVDAALEPMRGVADEVVAPRASGNRVRKEERGLEEDVAGLQVGLGAV